MPAAPSRLRSRRACSARDSRSAPPASIARGSATSVSVPVSTSIDHNAPTGSVPCSERRKVSRAPVGSSWSDRGAPRVKPSVRASERGGSERAVGHQGNLSSGDIAVVARR